MQAEAPGKLILSGEHSVVYGAPALAIPVTSGVRVSFDPNSPDSITIISDHLGQASFSLQHIQDIPGRLDQRFSAFLEQKLSISDVLSSPFELLLYTLVLHGFSTPGTIHISSQIPAGAGMGSSAAVICALIKLAAQSSGQSLHPELLFEKVRYCERLQHGRGSAIDAATVSYAKAVKVISDSVTELALTLDENWFVWNSGTAVSSTGETVAAVRKRFSASEIWSEFAAVTCGLEEALYHHDSSRICRLIQANQQLLDSIGVVPGEISRKIRKIEQSGGAAKICGAGSVTGSTGGMVLIYLPAISPGVIEHQLNISLEPLSMV